MAHEEQYLEYGLQTDEELAEELEQQEEEVQDGTVSVHFQGRKIFFNIIQEKSQELKEGSEQHIQNCYHSVGVDVQEIPALIEELQALQQVIESSPRYRKVQESYGK